MRMPNGSPLAAEVAPVPLLTEGPPHTATLRHRIQSHRTTQLLLHTMIMSG